MKNLILLIISLILLCFVSTKKLFDDQQCKKTNEICSSYKECCRKCCTWVGHSPGKCC